MAHVCEGYAPFFDAVCTHQGDVAAVTRAFDSFRVLCAVREGTRGVHALNQQCEQMLRAAVAGLPSMPAGTRAWYPGRPVIVLRNDYVVKLFNGDVGITLPRRTWGPSGVLPGPDKTFRAVAPARLARARDRLRDHRSQVARFGVRSGGRGPSGATERGGDARTALHRFDARAQAGHAVRPGRGARTGGVDPDSQAFRLDRSAS